MRVRRFAALIATAVVVVGLYAAYDPAAVGASVASRRAARHAPAWRCCRSDRAAGAVAAPNAAAPSKPPVVVVVGHAARKDLPWKLDEIGTAQAIASVALRPHFDATVDKVLVADGAAVKAGETLIELDARQVRAQIDGAKAQLAKDQAALEQAQRDVTRYADLVARAATPQLNLDNARTAEASARAAILGDQAAIENLEVQLGWYTITAPISGRVGVVAIKQGNVAKASDNSAAGVFATINQISPIYVAFSVQQSLLPALREAMAEGATVEATPQGSTRHAPGKLALVDNSVDPTTGTIVAHAIFDNADEILWPGQLCDLTLTLRDRTEHRRRAARGGADRPERQLRLHRRRRRRACAAGRSRPHSGRRNGRPQGPRRRRDGGRRRRAAAHRGRQSRDRATPPNGAS